MQLGILGCGLIGEKRARAARAAGDKVTAVYDVDPARAQKLSAITEAKAVESLEAFLSTATDAVVIATSHDHLTALTMQALRVGKHVIVEKPAARNAEELAPVLPVAAKAGKTVKVGFNHRFHPAFQRARQIVNNSELGPLLYIRGRYGHGGRVGYEKEWRFDPARSGGGELLDQGSHLIDLSRWFLGDFVKSDGAAPRYFWPGNVDDNAFLFLRTSTEQVAWLHASWTEWKNIFSFEIFGRDGKLHIEGLGGSYGVEKLTFYRMLPQMGPPETTTWEYPFPDTSWDLEYADFKAAIQENRQPCGNLEDALANLRVVGQIYQGKYS